MLVKSPWSVFRNGMRYIGVQGPLVYFSVAVAPIGLMGEQVVRRDPGANHRSFGLGDDRLRPYLEAGGISHKAKCFKF